MPKHHTLTQQAERDLADMVEWSRARWGKQLTDKYLDDIYEGSERIGKDHGMLRSREELSADSGLLIYPVRKHYVVCHAIHKEHIVVVSYIKQGRDVPAIIERNHTRIARELKEIAKALKRKDMRLPKGKKRQSTKQ